MISYMITLQMLEIHMFVSSTAVRGADSSLLTHTSTTATTATTLPPLYLDCVYSTTTTTPLVLPRIVLVYGAYSAIYCNSV